jgi:hypothetical protein
MPTPIEAYREGYEKGRKENLAGHTAEAVFGMFKDDPGSHYGAGYRDGAAGKTFSPPSDQVRKPAADVNPFDDKVAIKTVCPSCGALDWFEWKFLGRLTDHICGYSWYVGPGTYTAMQIRAAFAAGGKGAKYLTSGVSGGEGAWIAKGMGWFMGVLLGLGIRLEFGVLMIPIQSLAGLFQAKKTVADIVTRSIVLAVTLGGIGIGIYEIQHAPRPATGLGTYEIHNFPTNRRSSSGLTEYLLLGRWASLRQAGSQSGTDNPVESNAISQQVFLTGNRALEKFYGAGDPGEPYPWRILDGNHIQIDFRGANGLPITVIYEVSLSNGRLLMSCVAKDYHGQGSGGCEQEKETWSLVSHSQSLNSDEQRAANKLTQITFAQPPPY